MNPFDIDINKHIFHHFYDYFRIQIVFIGNQKAQFSRIVMGKSFIPSDTLLVFHWSPCIWSMVGYSSICSKNSLHFALVP